MNPYEILGVERDASPEHIKKAFRNLVKKHHPDTNPEDGGERFLQIKAAYEVLGDPDRRAYYDKTGQITGSSTRNAEEEDVHKTISNLFFSALNKVSMNFPHSWTGAPIVSDADFVLQAMKDDLQHAITRGENMIPTNLKEIKRLAKMGVAYADQEDPILSELLSGKIETLRRNNEEVQKGVVSLKKAYDRLKKIKPGSKMREIARQLKEIT